MCRGESGDGSLTHPGQPEVRLTARKDFYTCVHGRGKDDAWDKR